MSINIFCQMNTTSEVPSRKRKLEQCASSSDLSENVQQKKRQRKEDPLEPRSQKGRREENQTKVDGVEYQLVASYLPPEILFRIFNESIFNYSDLQGLRTVCNSWNDCLKDEAFSWRFLLKDRLMETFKASSGNRFTVNLENVLNARTKAYEQRWMIQILEGDKALGVSVLLDYSAKYFADILDSNIYAYDLSKRDERKGAWRYFLTVRINFARLERLIRNEEKVPIDLLTAVVITKLKLGPFLAKIYDAKKSYNPEADQFVVEQPASITGIKMHKYQISAINWMVFREKEANKAFALSPLIPIGRANMYLYGTSTSHEILYLDTAEQIQRYNLAFKSKGGIIADEMGLGKTVEVIGLIVSNPRTDFTPVEAAKERYQTKATLITCPNHLVAQWKSEIEKYCGKKMTALMITTIVQVKKYTSQDILNADVVLITYNLLRNDKYAEFKSENEKKQRKVDAKGVILEQFHWHRMVADECHEQEQFPKFNSTYCWYMTGTPFPQASFLGLTLPVNKHEHHMRQFNPNNNHTHRCFFERYIEDMLDDILVNNCLWRNTKASIKDEYELVKTQSKYMLLDFTPLERVIYQDKIALYQWCNEGFAFCNTFATVGEEASLTELFQKRKREVLKSVKHLESTYSSLHTTEMKERQQKILKLYDNIEIKPMNAEENSLEWLIERFGTKLAHLYVFLQDLFKEDDEARALIFSTDDKYLAVIKEMLEQRGIYTSTVKGNVHKKSKELKNFKDAESMVRVVLLNTSKVASGMNLIEASHVIFMDVCGGSDGVAHEAQAIGRAYRQGQTKQVTVVRFAIKGTTDFEQFARRCPDWGKQNASPVQNQAQSNNTNSTAKLVRSGSFGVLLANSQ